MGVSEYEITGKLQRKIDVYLRCAGGGTLYLHSTNWHRTCRDAAAAAVAQRGPQASTGRVFARFAKRKGG